MLTSTLAFEHLFLQAPLQIRLWVRRQQHIWDLEVRFSRN